MATNQEKKLNDSIANEAVDSVNEVMASEAQASDDALELDNSILKLQASTPLERRACALIVPSLRLMGYEVVRIKQIGAGARMVLQIMLEKEDGSAVDVNDCEQASHQVSAVLDVDDPIEDRYQLEVSSTGIDRPLTRPGDFINHIDYDVLIESEQVINGARRFKGKIIAADEAQVTFAPRPDSRWSETPEPIIFAYEGLSRAKLQMTDELLQKGPRAAKK